MTATEVQMIHSLPYNACAISNVMSIYSKNQQFYEVSLYKLSNEDIW